MKKFIAVLLTLVALAQGFQTFFGEDLNPTQSTCAGTGCPNSLAAETSWTAAVVGGSEVVQDFEGITVGTTAPFTIEPGVVWTQDGDIEDSGGAGRFATSGTQYVEASLASAVQISVNSRSAFGFYATDLGDFGGQVSVSLTTVGAGVQTFNIPHTINSPNGAVVFFGMIADDSTELITQISIQTTTTSDVSGFDDFRIADAPCAGCGADPHFRGFRGEEYDCHGQDGKIMAVFSDIDIQINGLIEAALEPLLYMSGKATTVFTKFGVLLAGVVEVTASVMPVEFSVEPEMPVNDDGVIILPDNLGSILVTENKMVIEFSGRYKIVIHAVQDILNIDQHYLDFDIRLINAPASQFTHGVLGQTLHPGNRALSSTGMQGEGVIEGVIEDYFVSSLHSSDFAYTAFESLVVPVDVNEIHEELTASSILQ